ncbi:glycosyltransferase family 2 protein [Alphaproteobacteria bacterium]|nr:glycosyltransferase family 2 protein [Alphaproteobacteria bacterium]
MTKTLLIHIGAHKTGTSSFQRSLRNNRKFFHEKGIDECPLFLGKTELGSRDEAVVGHTHFYESLRFPTGENVRKLLFENVFNASSHKNFIISDEHLSMGSRFLLQNDFEYLFKYVDKVVVRYFARDPLDYAWSLYKEYSTWKDYQAISFKHFMKFNYENEYKSSSAIIHYSQFSNIDFRVRLYPRDHMSKCCLREFGIEDEEEYLVSKQRVYPSLPNEWMDNYLKNAKSLHGEAKSLFNHAFLEIMEEFRHLPVFSSELPDPEYLQAERDYLFGQGIIAKPDRKRKTISKLIDNEKVKKKLQSWPELFSEPLQNGAVKQATGTWCLATLTKAGDSALERYLKHHMQFDFHRLLVFIDGKADRLPSWADHDRIQVIECSSDYWNMHHVKGDIDSKILHCHQVTREFCKQHDIEWYFHSDGDELLSTGVQTYSIKQSLGAVREDVNEIRVNPFEVSFIYRAKDLRLVRYVLKRPTQKAPNMFKLRNILRVRLRQFIMLFDRSFSSRRRPSGAPGSHEVTSGDMSNDDHLSQQLSSPPQRKWSANSLSTAHGIACHIKKVFAEVLSRSKKHLSWLGQKAGQLFNTCIASVRPPAGSGNKAVLWITSIKNATSMYLAKRNLNERQRLLPTINLTAWYSKVLGPYARLTEFGFTGHQAGKSFRRVSRHIWNDNSHSALYKYAAGKKLKNFSGVILVHNDCGSIDEFRSKLSSRIENHYISMDMSVRRKMLSCLLASQSSDQLYFLIYGIQDEYAAEGLNKGYLLDLPRNLVDSLRD